MITTRTAPFASVTTFTRDEARDCHVDYLGNYGDATHDLHSVNVHDVTNITRRTRTQGGVKHTVITLYTAGGKSVEITAFLADEV